MAHKYKVSVPQLAIRYCLELGTLPLPKSANLAHITNNAAVDFKISAEMTILKELPQVKDYGNSSDFLYSAVNKLLFISRSDWK